MSWNSAAISARGPEVPADEAHPYDVKLTCRVCEEPNGERHLQVLCFRMLAAKDLNLPRGGAEYAVG